MKKCLICMHMNKCRKLTLTNHYYTEMVQMTHLHTHLPPFLRKLLVQFTATGSFFLVFNFWSMMELGFTFVMVIQKSWTSCPGEPPDCAVICSSMCTPVYLVMESKEDNVFWASHWEFCIFIVLADYGFSPCSNILHGIAAIGAITGPGGFCW